MKNRILSLLLAVLMVFGTFSEVLASSSIIINDDKKIVSEEDRDNSNIIINNNSDAESSNEPGFDADKKPTHEKENSASSSIILNNGNESTSDKTEDQKAVSEPKNLNIEPENKKNDNVLSNNPESTTNVKNTILTKEEELAFVIKEEEIVGWNAPADFNGSVTIPAQLSDGRKIKSIGAWVFHNKKIKSLILENGIEKIGDYAFSENLISEIDLPETLKHVGEGAFQSNKIKKLNTNKLSFIGNSAFQKNAITELVFNAANEQVIVEAGAFKSNDLTRVNVPTNVKFNGPEILSYNNRYVKVFTENKNITGEITPGSFGYVVNPAIVTIQFIDIDTGKKITADRIYGNDLTKEGEAFTIGQETKLSSPLINNYRAEKDVVSIKPSSESASFNIYYKYTKTPPRIVAEYITIAEGEEITEEKFKLNAKAFDFSDKDISDKIEVELETKRSDSPGFYTVKYKVKDDFGNAAVLESKFLIGTDWGELEIGKGWKVKDFTYEGNIVTGLSASGKEKIKSNKDLVVSDVSTEGKTITAAGKAKVASVDDYFIRTDYEVNSIHFMDNITRINSDFVESYFISNYSSYYRFPEITFREKEENNLSSMFNVRHNARDSKYENGKDYVLNYGFKKDKITMRTAIEDKNRTFTSYLDRFIELSDTKENFSNLVNTAHSYAEVSYEPGRWGYDNWLKTKNSLIDKIEGKSIKSIGERAFAGTVVEVINMPSLDQVEDCAFFIRSNRRAMNGTDFNGGTDLSKVSERIYENKINRIVAPKITKIGDFAFAGTGLYNNLNFNSLDSVGKYAFENCQVPEINMPKLAHVPEGMNKGNVLFVKLSFDSAKDIGFAAFGANTGIYHYDYGHEYGLLTRVLKDNQKYHDDIYRKKRLFGENIKLPNIDKIDDYAFSGSEIVGPSSKWGSFDITNVKIPNISPVVGGSRFNNNAYDHTYLSGSSVPEDLYGLISFKGARINYKDDYTKDNFASLDDLNGVIGEDNLIIKNGVLYGIRDVTGGYETKSCTINIPENVTRIEHLSLAGLSPSNMTINAPSVERISGFFPESKNVVVNAPKLTKIDDYSFIKLYSGYYDECHFYGSSFGDTEYNNVTMVAPLLKSLGKGNFNSMMVDLYKTGVKRITKDEPLAFEARIISVPDDFEYLDDRYAPFYSSYFHLLGSYQNKDITRDMRYDYQGWYNMIQFMRDRRSHKIDIDKDNMSGLEYFNIDDLDKDLFRESELKYIKEKDYKYIGQPLHLYTKDLEKLNSIPRSGLLVKKWFADKMHDAINNGNVDDFEHYRMYNLGIFRNYARVYILNPIDVTIKHIDKETGKEIAKEDVIENIYEDTLFDPKNIDGYKMPDPIKFDVKSVGVDTKAEIVFEYSKYDEKEIKKIKDNTLGFGLSIEKVNPNNGPYPIETEISSMFVLNLKKDQQIKPGNKILFEYDSDVYYKPRFDDKMDRLVISSSKEIDGGLICEAQNIYPGFSAKIPTIWKFKKFSTPEGVEHPINVSILDKNNNVIASTRFSNTGASFSAKLNPPVFKAENRRYVGSAIYNAIPSEDVSKEENRVRGSASRLRLESTERYITRIEIEGSVPYYKDQAGNRKLAEVDKDNFPKYIKVSEDGKTFSGVYEGKNIESYSELFGFKGEFPVHQLENESADIHVRAYNGEKLLYDKVLPFYLFFPTLGGSGRWMHERAHLFREISSQDIHTYRQNDVSYETNITLSKDRLLYMLGSDNKRGGNFVIEKPINNEFDIESILLSYNNNGKASNVESARFYDKNGSLIKEIQTKDKTSINKSEIPANVGMVEFWLNSDLTKVDSELNGANIRFEYSLKKSSKHTDEPIHDVATVRYYYDGKFLDISNKESVKFAFTDKKEVVAINGKNDAKDLILTSGLSSKLSLELLSKTYITGDIKESNIYFTVPNGLDVSSIKFNKRYNEKYTYSTEPSDNGTYVLKINCKNMVPHSKIYYKDVGVKDICDINFTANDLVPDGKFKIPVKFEIVKSDETRNFVLENDSIAFDLEGSRPKAVIREKTVKNERTGLIGRNGIIAESNDRLTYNLKILNLSEQDRQNIVAVDVLPDKDDERITGEIGSKKILRGSEFAVKLDLSRKVKADNFTVYYLNTDKKITNDMINDNSVWSNTPASNTKALKFVSKDGFVQKVDTEINIEVPVLAPSDNDYELSGKLTANSFASKDNFEPEFIESNNARFTMKTPEGSIRLRKVKLSYNKDTKTFDKIGLQGAVFRLSYVDGTPIEEVTSASDGSVVFENVALLKDVVIEEVKAPIGFFLDKFKKTIPRKDLLNNRNYDLGDVKNSFFSSPVEPIKGTIKFKKVNSDGDVVKGISFTATNKNSHETYTFSTNYNGEVVFADIPYGTYTITENVGNRLFKPIDPITVKINKMNQVIDLGELVNDKAELNIAAYNMRRGLNKIEEIPGIGSDSYNVARVDAEKVSFEIFEGNKKIADSSIAKVGNPESLSKVHVVDNLEINKKYTAKIKVIDNGKYKDLIKKVNFYINGQGKLIHTDTDKEFFTKELRYPLSREKELSAIRIKVIDQDNNPVSGAKIKLNAFKDYWNKEIDKSEIMIEDAPGVFSKDGIDGQAYQIDVVDVPDGYSFDFDDFNKSNERDIFRPDVFSRQEKEYTIKVNKININLSKIVYLAKNQEKSVAEDVSKLNPNSTIMDSGLGGYDVVKNVDGAKFEIRDALTGEVVDKVKSDVDGKINLDFSKLSSRNNYVLYETNVPEGLDQTKRAQFNLDLKSWSKTPDIYRTGIRESLENFAESGTVKIIKYDKTLNKNMAGVTFTLYDNSGKAIRNVKTDKTGYAEIKGIPFGDYTLKETATIEGYKLDKNPVEVHLEKGKIVESCHFFYNKIIQKTVDVNFIPVDNKGESIIRIVNKKDGSAYNVKIVDGNIGSIKHLIPGDYTIHSISGCKITGVDTKGNFEIKVNDEEPVQNFTVFFKNNPNVDDEHPENNGYKDEDSKENYFKITLK